MKNLKQIITVVALAIFMLTAHSSEANSILLPCDSYDAAHINSEKTIIAGPIIVISIEIGRKSRNCRGIGICNIGIGLKNKKGMYEGTNENGNFVLIFSQKGMSKIQEHFKGNEIILEEDYVLSENITKKLGLKKGYVLKIGTYSISSKKKDGTYSVTM